MTPGRLVKAVAVALDVPEETVVQHDRNLAVAGLRTKGGRGRSAPKVTILDAARLFVATLGSVRTKDSVAIVKAFEAAQFDPPRSLAEFVADARRMGHAVPHGMEHVVYDNSKFTEPAIDVLPENHSFVEAIAALISDASRPVGDLDTYLKRFATLTVECDSRFLRAHIRRRGESVVGSANYSRDRPSPVKALEKPSASAEQPRYKLYSRVYGIHQRRDAPGTAIMLLGGAFRDGGLPFETTQDALDALLGTKRLPAKAIKAHRGVA
jgi:hypothetical protein